MIYIYNYKHVAKAVVGHAEKKHTGHVLHPFLVHFELEINQAE
jgi:hypothetical protein